MLASLAHLAQLLPNFARLAPDVALLVLTVGLLLIYVELNRPGWIVSGAVGLTATLFAVASLARAGVNPAAVVLVGTAVALLGVDLRRRTPVVVSIAATLALVLGFAKLVRGPGVEIKMGTAVGCGLVLGGCTSILTRIARRARTNKGLD
jgi:membrane-bound serine protease (ClpP class)